MLSKQKRWSLKWRESAAACFVMSMSPTETRRFSILIYVTANTVPRDRLRRLQRSVDNRWPGSRHDADGLTDVKEREIGTDPYPLIPMTRMVTVTCSSPISSERFDPLDGTSSTSLQRPMTTMATLYETAGTIPGSTHENPTATVTTSWTASNCGAGTDPAPAQSATQTMMELSIAAKYRATPIRIKWMAIVFKKSGSATRS